MNDERWRRIEALFQAARELELGERMEFLDKACAGDEEQRREIESLLTEHDREGNPLGDAVSNLAAEWAQVQQTSRRSNNKFPKAMPWTSSAQFRDVTIPTCFPP